MLPYIIMEILLPNAILGNDPIFILFARLKNRLACYLNLLSNSTASLNKEMIASESISPGAW